MLELYFYYLMYMYHNLFVLYKVQARNPATFITKGCKLCDTNDTYTHFPNGSIGKKQQQQIPETDCGLCCCYKKIKQDK